MHKYDEVYVISDIHLGGEKNHKGNFQIFKYGDRLAGLIRYIAELDATTDVALILNGDIFDSLAEDGVPGYVAAGECEARDFIKRIAADASFVPVWDALRDFVSREHRHLILVIGNHDIEIALPVVQNDLIRLLADGSTAASEHIHFATTGAGYTCLVGGARVFCTHGNETDKFNWIDYNGLAQLANAINAGRSINMSEWQPNAGTRLVVDVMNKVKKKFPFVDVLKPETSAIAAVLLALDKETFGQLNLRDAFPITWGAVKGKRETSTLLGDDVSPQLMSDELIAERVIDSLAGPHLRGMSDVQKDTEDELLARAIAASGQPIVTSDRDQDVETLGFMDIVAGRLGLMDRPEALRRALLDWIEEEAQFDIDYEDDVYKAIAQRVGPDIDVVVTGHTHMARAIRMPGGACYFNSGTWIRTLRFTKEVLENKAIFRERVWPQLRTGTLDTLDEVEFPGPSGESQRLLTDRTHCVRIATDDGGVCGALLLAQLNERDELELVPDSANATLRVNSL